MIEPRRGAWVDALRGDIRMALRSIRRSPGFAAAIVLTLALGMGANATVLSALYGLVLRPLPVENPGTLVQLFNLREARNPANPYSESGWAQYDDLRSRTELFEAAALRTPVTMLVARDGAVERVRGQKATADLFEITQTRPVIGRFFRADEVSPGPGHVIVLSESAWASDYGADPDVIGRQLELDNGILYTVIGVAPRSLEAFDNAARFTIPYVPPARLNRARDRYNAHSDDLWLRLHDGVSREAALERVRAIEREWSDNVADADGRRVFGFYEGRVRFDLPHPLEGPLYLLQIGALLIFLAGCFNVSTLLLIRMGRRSHELAIRLALGARRNALRRLVCIEGLLLAGLAAAAATAAARAGTAGLNRTLAALSPSTVPLGLDAGVLLASLAASVLLVGALSVLPLEVLWRTRRLRRLDAHGRSAGSGASSRFGTAMVVGQIAVSFVLLIGAGLFLTSFRNVLAVAPGFDAASVVEGRLDFDTVRASYPSRPEAARLQSRIHAAVSAIPGVDSVAFSMFPMFGNDMRSGGRNFLQGAAADPAAVGHIAHIVSPGFFATMGIARVAGSGCEASNGPGAVIIDDLFAQRAFGSTSPLGHAVPAPPGTPEQQIVGVVGRANLRGQEQRDGQPILYWCEPVGSGWWEYSILLRSSRPGGEIARALRQALRAVDPRLPLSYTQSLTEALDDMTIARRAVTLLFAGLAAAAVLLATIGVYALVAGGVARRSRELGIRMAIGATPLQVYRMILTEGLARAAAGLAFGLAGAMALGRLLRRFLFDVTSTDPLVYTAAAVLAILVTVIACLAPARRAAGIDPAGSLRSD